MKFKLTLFFSIVFSSYLFAQQEQLTFTNQNIDFSAPPRTTINAMSIKLWDSYNNGGPTPYGTIMEIYGKYGHQTGQLNFGGWDNSKIRYREAFYAQSTWSDWMTLLDSKNNVESIGRLMVSGVGNHYITGGNVGIGMTNPIAKLDVSGDLNSFNAAFGQLDGGMSTKNFANFSSNNHGSVLISSNLFFSGNDELKTARTHPTMSGASIIIPGNNQPNQGGIVFYTNTPASVTEGQVYTGKLSMAIKADGNIGIGTASPQDKLTVAGTIGAREIKVSTSAGADFVFEPDYKLTDLTELEKFVKTNKHLPEIPTAKQMIDNGVNLGELNIKLLQKVEELTLHLIEKDKELNAQRGSINKLESKLEQQDKIFAEILKKFK